MHFTDQVAFLLWHDDSKKDQQIVRKCFSFLCLYGLDNGQTLYYFTFFIFSAKTKNGDH